MAGHNLSRLSLIKDMKDSKHCLMVRAITLLTILLDIKNDLHVYIYHGFQKLIMAGHMLIDYPYQNYDDLLSKPLSFN
jgi:hypothetical protein